MSTERGDDERLRDADVDAAWRAASAEEPARDADSAILAAARAQRRSSTSGAAAGRRLPWWTRWQPLAAAAGIAALAFVLVERLPTGPSQPQPQQQQPATRAASAAPAPVMSTATAEQPAPATAPAVEARRETEASNRPQSKASSEPMVGAPAASARDSANATAGAGETGQRASEQQAVMAVTKPPGSRPDPDAWAQRIVDLHAAGENDAAAEELRMFRQAYPDADARLPARLRDWAAEVQSGPDR